MLKSKSGETGICFHPVSPPKVFESPIEPNEIKDLSNYITDKELREIFSQKIDEIKSLNKNIKEYPTSGYVGFLYKTRLIAYLSPLRKAFNFVAMKLDDDGAR